MEEELELVYMSLNKLLDDICKFLKDGVNKEALTPETRKQADNLIRRSKVQLQKIAIITKDSAPNKNKNERKNELKKSSSHITYGSKSLPSDSLGDHSPFPFSDFAAKDLPKEEKYGYISWKTKFIFGFEKLKRVYAGICGDWLLIYYNEKDSKPAHSYNLKIHKAQMLPVNKQLENASMYFCLINIETQWISQFMAQTHKDMLQWVAKINKCHNMMNQRQPQMIKELPEIAPSSTEVEELDTEDEDEDSIYDLPSLRNNKSTKIEAEIENEDSEEVYDEVLNSPAPPVNHNTLPKPSKIPTVPFKLPTAPSNKLHLPVSAHRVPSSSPTRMQQTPLPPLPIEESDSSESLPTYDNPMQSENWDKQSVISGSHESFSEDEEEEEIYDLPLPPPKIMESPPREEPLVRRDSLKPVVMPKPSSLTKPKIDVKILKPSSNGKTSTKQILKLAKETSIK